MKTQLDEGVSKNMMSASQANALKSRADGLLAQANSINYASKAECDSLERQINQLNIDIHHSFDAAAQIGSGGVLQ